MELLLYLNLAILLTTSFEIKPQIGECRFAKDYKAHEFFEDDCLLEYYLETVINWETHFIR